jgi:DNA-binding NarL/FixJ family response regulator
VRVVIADDALLIREGLARVLTAAGIEVTALVSDVDELLAAVILDPPDVAIVDIRMPPSFADEGLRAAALLADRAPEVGVLVLSQYTDLAYAAALLDRSEARRGYLLKDRILHRDEVVSALYRIAAGQTVIDESIVATLLSGPAVDPRLAMLTAREREVLELIAQGCTDHGICERLHLSPKTVATHIQHIFGKLGLPAGRQDNRRVHAVLTYLDASSA